MSIPSYNRGEWAELYVLAKVLCDQSITVQVHGEGSAQRSLSVLKVKRGTTSTVESFSVNGIGITCDHTSKEVQREEICLRVPALLRSIKNGKGNSFHLEEGEEMMRLLDIKQLKQGSGIKSDLFINVIDPLTGNTGIQGYSIKALLGSKPTLLNASGPTNLAYRIEPSLSTEKINEYNRTDKSGKLVHGIRDTVQEIIADGHQVICVEVDARFRENLELLDSKMPEFVSEALLAYYSRQVGKDASVLNTIRSLSNSNPLEVKNSDFWYLHKIKDLLEASAYGMVPTEPYNGERTAAGGLLLVQRDGSLLCFRLDDKDRTRDYLVEHTYFETASRQKHNFGLIESVDGHTQIKLNLQVRYK